MSAAAHVRDEDLPGSGVAKAYVALLLAFFLLMLVFPTIYRAARGALLALLLLGAAVYVMHGRWVISRTILAWSVVTVSAGLLFMWNGAMLGAPGAVKVGTVHVLWPLLYLFFIGIMRRVETIVLLHKTIVAGVLISALLGIMLVVGTLAGYGDLLATTLAEHDVAAGMYDGFSRYRMSNIPTLVYGTGFLLTLLSIPRANRWCSRRWTALAWLTMIPLLAAIVLSGRRAAWLVVLLAPVLVFGLMLASRQIPRLRPWLALALLGALAGVGILAYFELQLSAITREFVNAFNFSAEHSASIRGQQGDALLADWMRRPLLGHGLGAGTHVVRNLDQPWAYELSYAALLFQTGIVGILIYGSAVLWVFWAGIKIVRALPRSASIVLPLLAGLAGFLIANGTNPYLAKFDYLWVIFLPIAAINIYLAQLRSASAVTLGRSSDDR